MSCGRGSAPRRCSRRSSPPVDGAGAPPFDDVRALFAEIDALEPEVRAAAPAAVARAAGLALDVEARLRALAGMAAAPSGRRLKRPKLLIVDDGDRYAELAHRFLRDYDYVTRCELDGPCWSCPERRGCTLTHAHDLGEAEAALARAGDVDAVLLDVAFELPEARLAPSDEPDPERRRRLQGLDILARAAAAARRRCRWC